MHDRLGNAKLCTAVFCQRRCSRCCCLGKSCWNQMKWTVELQKSEKRTSVSESAPVNAKIKCLNVWQNLASGELSGVVRKGRCLQLCTRSLSSSGGDKGTSKRWDSNSINSMSLEQAFRQFGSWRHRKCQCCPVEVANCDRSTQANWRDNSLWQFKLGQSNGEIRPQQ